MRFLASELDGRLLRDSDDALGRMLGFNLDLPHWGFLERITPAPLRREPDILRRVIHGHCSDHWVGHVTDSRTRVFHGEVHFKEWLRLVGEINASAADGPFPFSGYLTCELECVSDLSIVADTLCDLDALLDRYCR